MTEDASPKTSLTYEQVKFTILGVEWAARECYDAARKETDSVELGMTSASYHLEKLANKARTRHNIWPSTSPEDFKP